MTDLEGVAVKRAKVAEAPRRVFIARHGLKEDGFKRKVNFGVVLHAEANEPLDVVHNFFKSRNGGQAFGRVLSSPFLRCRQTAARLVPGAKILIDPGLSECMEHWGGLMGQNGEFGKSEDPSVVASQVAALIPQIEEVMGSQIHSPLMQVSDLQPEYDHGVERAARVAWELKKRHDLFAEGPLVLVTHGSPSYGMIEGLLDSSSSIVPVFDHTRMPEMGSVTELLGQEDGTWRLIGNASPVRASDGSWECKWTAGAAAAGADHTKL